MITAQNVVFIKKDRIAYFITILYEIFIRVSFELQKT